MAFRSHIKPSNRILFLSSTTAAAVAIGAWAYHRDAVRNEDTVVPEPTQSGKIRTEGKDVEGAGRWSPYVWGSNRYSTLSPSSSTSSSTVIKQPRPLSYTGSTPLRDLILAEQFGAAVDARGDLWCWGDGYDGDVAEGERSGKAGRSLTGKNISKVTTTPYKIYALSTKSGRIYTVPSARSLQLSKKESTNESWWPFGLQKLWSTDSIVDAVEVVAEGGLKKGERFVDVVSGRHHVLALTSQGRTFSMPASSQGNSHFQLGTRHLPPLELTQNDDPTSRDIRYATTLSPITSLSAIAIAQISAGDRTSFVRTTAEGRVLGFGANEYGQIGLGSFISVDKVPTPTEVVLAKGYRGGTTVRCLDVAAGANNTFFTVERSSAADEGKRFIDLLAVGSGVTGTLGHGLWSSVSGTPVRVKTVSGLQEYSDAAQTFLPVNILHMAISPSPTPHAIATLHTVAQSDAEGVAEGKYGNDVMVWGANGDYQLGNGRRSNLAVPQHLPPLGCPGRGDADVDATKQEASINSGTLSPMPHSRLQLLAGRADAYDLDGKLIKQNVKVEETIVAGWNASAVYNKIVE